MNQEPKDRLQACLSTFTSHLPNVLRRDGRLPPWRLPDSQGERLVAYIDLPILEMAKGSNAFKSSIPSENIVLDPSSLMQSKALDLPTPEMLQSMAEGQKEEVLRGKSKKIRSKLSRLSKQIEPGPTDLPTCTLGSYLDAHDKVTLKDSENAAVLSFLRRNSIESTSIDDEYFQQAADKILLKNVQGNAIIRKDAPPLSVHKGFMIYQRNRLDIDPDNLPRKTIDIRDISAYLAEDGCERRQNFCSEHSGREHLREDVPQEKSGEAIFSQMFQDDYHEKSFTESFFNHERLYEKAQEQRRRLLPWNSFEEGVVSSKSLVKKLHPFTLPNLQKRLKMPRPTMLDDSQSRATSQVLEKPKQMRHLRSSAREFISKVYDDSVTWQDLIDSITLGMCLIPREDSRILLLDLAWARGKESREAVRSQRKRFEEVTSSKEKEVQDSRNQHKAKVAIKTKVEVVPDSIDDDDLYVSEPINFAVRNAATTNADQSTSLPKKSAKSLVESIPIPDEENGLLRASEHGKSLACFSNQPKAHTQSSEECTPKKCAPHESTTGRWTPFSHKPYFGLGIRQDEAVEQKRKKGFSWSGSDQLDERDDLKSVKRPRPEEAAASQSRKRSPPRFYRQASSSSAKTEITFTQYRAADPSSPLFRGSISSAKTESTYAPPYV